MCDARVKEQNRERSSGVTGAQSHSSTALVSFECPINVGRSQWVRHNTSVAVVVTGGIEDRGTRQWSGCRHRGLDSSASCDEKLGNPRAGAFDRLVAPTKVSSCSTREPHFGPRP